MIAKKLCVAVDVKSREDAFAIADYLLDLPVVLKLGLKILPRLRSEDFSEFRNMGFELFIDAKLHDIPSQVHDAASTWAELGARYLTYHVVGGEDMVRGIHEALAGSMTTPLGVTVLTSLDAQALNSIGVSADPSTQVKNLFQKALTWGMKGSVCSAQEVTELSKLTSDHEFVFCTPGLYTDKSTQASDQKRSISFSEALKTSANLLVVGRAVLSSASPRDSVKALLQEMDNY